MYLDNPNNSKKYLRSLSPKDRLVYSKGYLQACEHLLEAFTITRSSLLSAMLEDHSDLSKDIAEGQIEVLDYYENLLSGRIEAVEAKEIREKA